MFTLRKISLNPSNIHYRKIVVILLLIGAAIRCCLFLSNQSLNQDETSLAFNVINGSYRDLFHQLKYEQMAPVLFLAATKFLTDAFGYSEYVFRLIPFAAGLISVFLFYLLSQKFQRKAPALISTALFSLSHFQIMYLLVFKQYSVDILLTIIILLFSINVYNSNFNINKCIWFGIIGILSIWASYTSFFVILGAAIVLFAQYFHSVKINRIPFNLPKLLILNTWIISFVVFYLTMYHNLTSPGLMELWNDSFAPIPFSFKNLMWYPITFISIINNPLELCVPGIVLLAVILGIQSFLKNKNHTSLALLVAPIFVLVFSSMSKLYPLGSEESGFRVILFIIPIMYIIIAEGAFEMYNIFERYLPAMGLIFLCVLFSFPVINSIKLITNIDSRSIGPDTRSVINYYLEQKYKGDKIYVYGGIENIFKYYTLYKHEEYIRGIIAHDEIEKYIVDIEKLNGSGRVWFLFSYVWKNEDNIFLAYLNRNYKMLDNHKSYTAAVYLYDLTASAR